MRAAVFLAAATTLLLLQGCTSTSTPQQRAALHGPPLTEAQLVELAKHAGTPEQVTVEARLRGFAFEWDSPTRSRFGQAGLSPPLIERLAYIANQPDTLGNQPRKGDALLTAAGITAAAAAIAGAVWLIIELDDDDHHHGHRHY